MDAFKCESDSKSNLKGISKPSKQSKNFNFEDYKKLLEAEAYQKECDNYIIRSLIHEMFSQK